MTLWVEPLPADDIRRLILTRLGVNALPETLVRLVTEKSEGNALFAEEILSFLTERGVLRVAGGKVEFDVKAVAAALPASVQSLLTERIDRLAPQERALLQAAAVIGRRFHPQLLSAVADDAGNVDARLATMQGLDLVHPEGKSGEYSFKHALVREALYQSLLTGPRAVLHLKIADELERRGGNRLGEIAETLANHYEATLRVDKAFSYLALAGGKSLDIYALPEAEKYFRRALEIWEAESSCAEPAFVVQLIARLFGTLYYKCEFRELIFLANKYKPMLTGSGESADQVVARYYQLHALAMNLNLRSALDLATATLQIAERVGDPKAEAFARLGVFLTRTLLGLDSPEAADTMVRALRVDADHCDDHLFFVDSHAIIASHFISRGLHKEARNEAETLLTYAENRGDLRAVSSARGTLSLICLLENQHDALGYVEECVVAAIMPFDRLCARLSKATATILIGRPREGLDEMDVLIVELERLGLRCIIFDAPRGIALAMLGRVTEGVRVIKNQIARSDAAGHVSLGALGRLTLAELYTHILISDDRPNASFLLKNFRTIVGAKLFGPRRAWALLEEAASVRQISEEGVTAARINYDLGVLSAVEA